MRRVLFAFGILSAACSLTSLDGFATGAVAKTVDDAGVPLPDASIVVSADAGDASDSYGDAIRADSPAAWFRFEDAPGAGTLKDELGTLRADVNAGITLGVDGAVAKAAEFKAGASVQLGNAFDFAGNGEFAIEVWGQNDEQVDEYEAILAKRLDDPGPNRGWVFFRDRERRIFAFQLWDNATLYGYAPTPELTPGFHHVVVTGTRAGGTLDLDIYLDGNAGSGATKAIAASQPVTSVPLTLAPNWKGRIDEITLYEHSLTAARVRAHFEAARR